MIRADWTPTDRKLRQFSAALLVVVALAVLRGSNGWLLLALGIVALCGFVWPALVEPLFIAAMMVSLPFGWALSHVLLRAIYYLVLTPVAVLFRLGGRDPLQLRRRDAASYWQPFSQGDEIETYFRQT